MAETKAERTESWKKTTSAHAAALRKAKATVYHPSTGKTGRTIPLTALTAEEVQAAATRAGDKPTVDMSKMYMGPGTGIGAPVSPLLTHTERIIKQETAKRLEDIQRHAFEERLRDPIPTIETGTGRAIGRVTEPVIKEYEAGISTKPTTTDKPPEYVPTPYKPGTQPGEVEYGKRPKFDQPQVHEVIKEKILGAEAIWSRLGDPLGLRHRQLPFTVPFYGTPEEQEEMAEKQIEMAPGAATEAIMAYTGGYILGGVTKAGVLGGRYITGIGAEKVVTKIPKWKIVGGEKVEWGIITLPKTIVKLKTDPATGLLKTYGFKSDPTKFRAGKFARDLITGSERIIEPAVGVGFGAAIVKDIAETPREHLTEMIMGLAVGFAGAEKGYRAPEKAIDILRVRGRKEIPVETIIEPQVLTGAEPFPFVRKGETVPELISRFTGPEYKLPTEKPGLPAVWHATAKAFPKEVIIEGGTVRPSDLPGLYVAPSVSPHFLRTGRIKTDTSKLSSWESMFGTPESLTPTILSVEVPGISRIPSKYRLSLEASKKYVSTREKAEAIITRDVELARLGKGIVEAEAVVPPASKLIRVGTDYYIRIGDRKIPIDKYIAEMHIKGEKKPGVTGVTEPLPRATPDPSYYLPRAKKRAPYYRGDTKPSTSLVDTVSDVPASVRDYVPTSPREYVPVGVSDYVPAPRSEVPVTTQEYVPPSLSEYLKQYSRDYVPPPKEYVAPYAPGYVPPSTITKHKPGAEKKTGFVRKDKMMPGYAWQLANPIASLEQLLGGKAPTRKKTNKKIKKTKSRRTKR